MEYIIVIVICVVAIVLLKIGFNVKLKDIKKIKEIGYDKDLNKIAGKFEDNKEICKKILDKLGNEDVKIEENNDTKSSLYIAVSNKIIIANIKDTFTRIQTIAHECLHSVQDRKILIFNFIFSNIYLLYYIVICVLALFNLLPFKMMFLSLFLILSLINYTLRMYLENDAMIKARFLAKEYMEEEKISSKEDIDEMVKGFDDLNNLGIKYIHYQIFLNCMLKILIFSIINTVF